MKSITQQLLISLCLSLALGWLIAYFISVPLSVKPLWLSNSLFYLFIFPGGLCYMLYSLFGSSDLTETSSKKTSQRQLKPSRSLQQQLSIFRAQDVTQGDVLQDKKEHVTEEMPLPKSSALSTASDSSLALDQPCDAQEVNIQLTHQDSLRLLTADELQGLSDHGYLSAALTSVDFTDLKIRRKLSHYLSLDFPMVLIEAAICHHVHGNRINALAQQAKELNLSEELLRLASETPSISREDLALYANEKWPLELIKLRESKKNFYKNHAKEVLSWPSELQELFLNQEVSFEEAQEFVHHDCQPFLGCQLHILESTLGKPHQQIELNPTQSLFVWISHDQRVTCKVEDDLVIEVDADVQQITSPINL